MDKIESQAVRRKEVMQCRHSGLVALKPREERISSNDNTAYFPNLEEYVRDKSVPVYQIRHVNPPSLTDVIASVDNSSLSGECLPYGSIVSDDACSNSMTLTQAANQLPSHVTRSDNNNQAHIGLANEASNTVSNQRTNGNREKGSKHPRYSTYDARKASYSTFRESRNLDTDQFAKTGFFHTGRDDVLQCFHCGMELHNWSIYNDAIKEHVKWSPDCSFLKEQIGIRTLDEYKAQIRSSEMMRGEEVSICMSSDGSATGGSSVPAVPKIRSPQYQAYSTRLSTFAKWPPSMMQRPDQVAQAGFYYTGLQDVVRCFACDGGLKNWDPEDDPWIEHARWFPKCPYVFKVKGQEYIDLVGRMADEEEDSTVRSSFQRDCPMTDRLTLEQLNLRDPADEPNQLETDVAQTVIQTGYSRKAVAMAIDDLLCKGMRQYTAYDIMTVILDKEDRGESLPLDDDSSQAFTPTPNLHTKNNTETENMDTDTMLLENESLKTILSCKKCNKLNRNILFLPCTHHCLCQACAEKCSLCPICYRIINEKIKTYMI